jgi:microsomal epoxide hydrolase
VTLYWFTESFPRAIYGYRQFFDNPPQFFHNDKQYYGNKPMGYVHHPEELAPVPKSLVAKVSSILPLQVNHCVTLMAYKQTGNLAWYREHPDGGHFYAMETPQRFVDDMEDFTKQVWK